MVGLGRELQRLDARWNAQMDQSTKGSPVMLNHGDSRRRPTGGNPGLSPPWGVPVVGAVGMRGGWRDPESCWREFLRGRDSFL